MKKESYLEVKTTLPNMEIALKISKEAVNGRLAACSQFSQIKSIFHWKDRLEEAEEILVVFKTTSKRFDELVSFIEMSHPYEVPEIWMINNAGGSQRYLEWIKMETNSDIELS